MLDLPRIDVVVTYVGYLRTEGRRITHLVPSVHVGAGGTLQHTQYNTRGWYAFPPNQPLWLRDYLRHIVTERVTLTVDRRQGNIYRVFVGDAVVDLESYWGWQQS